MLEIVIDNEMPTFCVHVCKEYLPIFPAGLLGFRRGMKKCWDKSDKSVKPDKSDRRQMEMAGTKGAGSPLSRG
jgi:hypothetical protein